MNTRALLALTLLITACTSSPVTVTRVDARDVHRRLTQSALSSGELSTFTRNVLLETDLLTLYSVEPAKALERLRDLAVSGSGGPTNCSPSPRHRSSTRSGLGNGRTISWIRCTRGPISSPTIHVETPSPFGPRLRLATDIYNRGLTSSLESVEGGQLALRAGAFDLPFGRQLHIAFDPEQLRWRGRDMVGFAPVAELRVSGLHGYYSERGIGVPLAATLAPLPGTRPKRLAGRRADDSRHGAAATAAFALPACVGSARGSTARRAARVEIEGPVPPRASPRRSSPIRSPIRPSGLRNTSASSTPSSSGETTTHSSTPACRIGQDVSQWCSCMGRLRRSAAGRKCTTASPPIVGFGNATSSGFSPTTRARPSPGRPCCSVIRSAARSSSSIPPAPIRRCSEWW